METPKKQATKKPHRPALRSAELELWFLGIVVLGVGSGLFWKYRVAPELGNAFGAQNTAAADLLLTVLGVAVTVCVLLIAAVTVMLIKVSKLSARLRSVEGALHIPSTTAPAAPNITPQKGSES